MAHRLLRDPQQDGWERSDMPIVCETCLGPNPFVRMQRIEYGGQCHISNRPYTVFRWRPGNDARYKKTIICQEVAKAKNVCQVCLLDLDYNLPVQVRDTALGLTNEDEPQSDVGKEYQLHQRVKEGDDNSSFAEGKPNDMLMRLQRTQPYYKRNMARVCTFFAKGACTRGAECPYRHELPTSGELADQNIKDRYYGINDPVANKMLKRAGDLPKLEPPEDTSITTLFLGGVGPEIKEEDIKDHFYGFGELAGIKKVESKNCAFVTYTTRSAAEKAASELHGKLIIKGQRLKLSWGKPQTNQAGGAGGSQAAAQGGAGQQPYATGPSGYGATQEYTQMYPSMAQDQMGTRIPAPGEPSKRSAETAAEPGQDSAKRPRQLPSGPPPPYMPPPMYPPQGAMPPPMMHPYGPPHMMPPPGYGMPGYGMMPPPGFPSHGFRPPMPGGPRPPAGARPPQAAPPAKQAAPASQQQQQPAAQPTPA